MPLFTDDQLTATINFTPAAEANGEVVDAVGMRFGDTGDIMFKDITPAEAAAGSATITFTIDPSVCNNIAQICHDLLCYEFAKTSAGTVTAANFQDVALMCGACDEPSCQVFCCTDGMTILNTNITENGTTTLEFNDCDMSVFSNEFSQSFSIGENTIFDDSFNPNSRRLSFNTDLTDLVEGQIFTDFQNISGEYQDLQVDRHIDDTNLSIYNASSYEGNDQGTIEIVTLREGLDQFGEENVLEFEVKFNNLKCESFDGEVLTYNGSITGFRL